MMPSLTAFNMKKNLFECLTYGCEEKQNFEMNRKRSISLQKPDAYLTVKQSSN